VERETVVARKRVQDAELVIIQELKDMSTAKSAEATTRTPETTFEEMLNGIGDSLSGLAILDREQDGKNEEDDEEDTELSKLSDDDEAGWVMCTISKTVQHCMESFWQWQMRFDESTQPGWRDTANDFRERDKKYGTAELQVPAVVKHQIDTTSATPSQSSVSEYIQTLDILRGQSQIQVVTSRPGSCPMGLGLKKPQLNKFIQVFSPDMASSSTLIQDAKSD
jgi:hypothetical protein